MSEPGALRVAVINGSPNQQSKTMGLAAVTLEALSQRMRIETHQIDVYRLGSGFSGASNREDLTREVEEEVRIAEEADLLIAATPIYRGSYTGLFKHFFDLIEQYTLADKPVLLLATGGGEKHALALDHALRPLFAFFQAHTLPVGVFASAGDFDGTMLLNPRIYSRITVALDDTDKLLSRKHRLKPE
ncbi:MAG TPA: NAD(P)H-dependent oxidoreductase [Candidatus Agrococcus pullicola]|uniref:NAD(P)H-dependent oxidoreductase n=1 Tax=Candidatus Agrococcus pullicola TaxID=2838429 RepID=A0A9D1YW21_9MICO|nr:NAD(P)H-dependent oxidoreductase [Candidatus Agrococcus pullicola]